MISLQAFHTCAVSSQSQRHPSTYSPAAMSFGTSSSSQIVTVVGQLPAHGPGFDPYCPLAMGARTAGAAPARQGGAKLSGPTGRGFIAHIDPAGNVPSEMYVPLMSSLLPSLHSKY